MPNIKFKHLELILLTFIALIGSFLYLHKLADTPPGVYVDEAITGYNAYSILKTGKDEYGKFLPAAFRLLGSYTPPLHIYLTVPLIAIFDLSVFSTRLLSAICGILNIFVIFFLIKNLQITKSKWTALISTLFFAITPWAVTYSRMGYEQNLAFLSFSVSALLISKSLKNTKLLILTIPFISLATYTDYALRFLAPLLLIASLLVFRKKFLVKINLKYLVIGGLIATLIQIPNLTVIFTPSFYTKSNHFYSDIISAQAAKIANFLPNIVATPLSFAREFLSQFFTYLSPRSLFFLPDPDPQRSLPELSTFYPWMVIPYLLGIFFLWKKRTSDSAKLVFLLLLITPLPGALTRSPFHIQRTLSLLLPITLIITVGLDKLISKRPKIIVFPAILGLFLFSLIFLWRSYFVLLPQERSSTWAFQFAPLANYIKSHPEKTFIIDQSGRTRPQDIAYTQLAFYLKLDPKIIQADQKADIANNYYTNTEFNFGHKIANIETKGIDWNEADWRKVVLVGDTVAISDPQVKLHNLTLVFEIRDPNNEIILRGFETNPSRTTLETQ